MELHLLELLSEYGYFGMFLLIMIENLFPPIPSEAVLSFGGFLTEHTELNLQGMLIAATAGSLAGAVILYWAGRIIPLNRLDHVLSNRLIRKAGFKEGDIKKTLKWFDRHENKAVLLGRCVPVITKPHLHTGRHDQNALCSISVLHSHRKRNLESASSRSREKGRKLLVQNHTDL